jgi:hypothetical protein
MFSAKQIVSQIDVKINIRHDDDDAKTDFWLAEIP